MDIVYIVGKGSRWENNELRYSLRSIDKYGIGVGNIFIIGTVPNFINRANVTCIEMEDATQYPAKNVYHKIKAAVECDKVSPFFLLSSDDHFFVRPTDFINYPLYYKSRELPTFADVNNGKFGGAQYTHGMANTREIMERAGLGHVYFEGHTNKLYSKCAWIALDKLGVWDMASVYKEGISTNTPMAAIIHQLNPSVDVLYRKDIKIQKFGSFTELDQMLSGTDSFSIGDSAIGCGMDRYLQWIFPEHSKYEK